MTRAERRRAAKAEAKRERGEQVLLQQLMVEAARKRHRAMAKPAKKPVRGIRPGEPDTRDEKYLNSYAKGMRALRGALAA